MHACPWCSADCHCGGDIDDCHLGDGKPDCEHCAVDAEFRVDDDGWGDEDEFGFTLADDEEGA